jgi:SAM-dependent methyltransferase
VTIGLGSILLLLGAIAFAQNSRIDDLKAQYDGTYSAPEEQSSFNQNANAFLIEMASPLKPGTALDVGMGQGRNAIWLAQHGWEVTGFDLSDVGVKLARERAEKLGVQLNAVVQSAEEFDFGKNRWDMVVVTYVPLSALLVDRIRQSLKPGGVVLLENFHAETGRVRLMGGGLADNELLGTFADFRILHYEDTWAKQDWGLQLGAKNRLVRMLAQKPASATIGCSWQGREYAQDGQACWGTIKMRCGTSGWEQIGKCAE